MDATNAISHLLHATHATNAILHATHAINEISHARMRYKLIRYNCLTVLKQSGNFSGGTKVRPDVFLRDICKRIFFVSTVFSFLHKKEMRSRTYYLQHPDVFLPAPADRLVLVCAICAAVLVVAATANVAANIAATRGDREG
jgi:hypothetical protein